MNAKLLKHIIDTEASKFDNPEVELVAVRIYERVLESIIKGEEPAKQKRQWTKRVKYADKQCAVCSETFKPRAAMSKFCTKRCRNKYWKNKLQSNENVQELRLPTVAI